ncbi:hypothetical protein ACIRP0_21870 [Streptomyces sp. NPDC101733]|uniref:hypothetical protein n=1 Tax=unclassified Streptomyces TaxID=2593676 RepID=UPI0038117F2D
MKPQPRKSPLHEPAEQSLADAFRRRPTRAPRGLAPGRRVWMTVGWAAVAAVPVAASVTLAQTGVLDFGNAHETAAVRDLPASALPSTQGKAVPPGLPPAPVIPSESATPKTEQPTPTAETKTQQPAPAPPAAPAPPPAPTTPRTTPQVAEAPIPLAPNTAASTVARLAAQTPGRHICYRAFVEGVGWQKAVCDGATAGTVGQKKKIKSLNIAVSGTKGTAANAFVHNEHWKTPWSSAANGVDLYVGGTAASYPYMLGFIINVGDGAVCQNAHVRDQGWLGLGCDKPLGQAAGNYIFGGTLDDNRWLEAVRFTV